MQGTVKFYNESKGFGFIISENGDEVFVHMSGVYSPTGIKQNDRVEFEVTQGKKGPTAVNVRQID